VRVVEAVGGSSLMLVLHKGAGHRILPPRPCLPRRLLTGPSDVERQRGVSLSSLPSVASVSR
jgi:hypothetical protein